MSSKLTLTKSNPRYFLVGLGSVVVIIAFLRSRKNKQVEITVANGQKKRGVSSAQFYARLRKILPIIIPGFRTKETAYIIVLAILLSSKLITNSTREIRNSHRFYSLDRFRYLTGK
jgi:hypothetical protein